MAVDVLLTDVARDVRSWVGVQATLEPAGLLVDEGGGVRRLVPWGRVWEVELREHVVDYAAPFSAVPGD